MIVLTVYKGGELQHRLEFPEHLTPYELGERAPDIPGASYHWSREEGPPTPRYDEEVTPEELPTALPEPEVSQVYAVIRQHLTTLYVEKEEAKAEMARLDVLGIPARLQVGSISWIKGR